MITLNLNNLFLFLSYIFSFIQRIKKIKIYTDQGIEKKRTRFFASNWSRKLLLDWRFLLM